MIAETNNIKKRIFDIKNGKIQEGLKIGVPQIDEFIRYKQGNFNLWIGHANVGKTTVITYFLTAWAIIHKLRFVIWSSENTPDSIVRKIIEFKMGKPIHTASETEIEKEIEWCNTFFKVIDVQDLYTYKDLLKEAKTIKDVWDYNGILIDPYNSLSVDTQMMRGIGSHLYDYHVASELRLFAKNQNITVFLNAHGVTEAMRRTYPKDHEYAGLPMPLGLSSVEGGGKWGNRSDDVICCHRMTNHPTDWMITELHVLKVKEVETGMRCTPYQDPLKIRMVKNNVGFEFMGQDILHSKKSNLKEILF
tara:strand:+ start:1705 stop:2619 length:915 start_codon:yes stop_codon:yes gene_type:complete